MLAQLSTLSSNATSAVYHAGVKQALNGIKFASGLNNLSNAFTHLRGKPTPTVTLTGSKMTVEVRKAPFVDRVRNSAGEVTIGAAKALGLTMFTHGGICTATKHSEWLNEGSLCADLSVLGIKSTDFFEAGVTASNMLLNAAVYTGQSTYETVLSVTPKVLPKIEKVARAALEFATTRVEVKHVMSSVGLVAAVGLTYSAYNDYQKINKPEVYQIQGKVITQVSTDPTFFEKMKLSALLVTKVAAAASILALTFASDAIKGDE